MMGPSKLPHTGTSIFTVMSALAVENDALNLSQGFPDFPVDPGLIDHIHRYMKMGFNQYAPMPGLPALRREIARVAEESFGRATDPDLEVTIFSGATEALFSTFMTLVHPGDEVIVFDPVYDSYDPAIRLAGGLPRHIRLNAPHFGIPWDEVKSAVNTRTRAIVINTPHNPTGTVLSAADLQQLVELSERNGLVVISDEVYERIIFNGAEHHSVLDYPELRERSVAIYSFGKTFHATGWKVGYSVASPKITAELRKVHQFVTFAVNTPIQHALADHLKDPANLQLGEFFQAKQERFSRGLKGSRFRPLACYGTYFQLVQVEDPPEMSDLELARKMTIENGIASIPVSVFYHDGFDQKLLRFCFAKSDETLDLGTELLRNIEL